MDLGCARSLSGTVMGLNFGGGLFLLDKGIAEIFRFV